MRRTHETHPFSVPVRGRRKAPDVRPSFVRRGLHRKRAEKTSLLRMRRTEGLPRDGMKHPLLPAPRYRTSEGKFMVTTRGDVERSSSRPS